ncbi:MAG TPA: PAS domain S-box protein, partial [Spirochaetes bacterium]|nr:PAS domain S-box protein [Spirochaetota bacterium]
FTLLMLLFQLAHRGFAFQHLWPQSTWWANICSPVFLNLMGSFSTLFLRETMETKNTSRPIDRLLSLLGFGLFPLAAAVSPALPVSVSLPATYYLLMAYVLAVISLTLYYFARKNRFARYFLGGVSLTGVFAIIGALTALGKLPSNALTEWSTEAGFLGLIIFASLGLVDHIMELNAALLLSKKDIARKNETLYLKNQELEATNEELQATMEELEASNEEFEAQNEELLRSQEELSASEQELMAIFNGSHDAFIIHDEKGRILDVNERMLELYRLDRAKALSLSIQDISADRMEIGAGLTHWARAMEGDNPVFEWRARRPEDGTCFDVEVGLSSLRRRGRTIILASVRDITFRKTAEEEVRRSERRFRAIFENAPYGISINRLDNLAFVAVSPAFEKNTGHRAEDVLGKNLAEIGMLGSVDDQKKILGIIKRDGKIEGLKIRLTLKNGATSTILLSSLPFELDNEIYLLNFTVNITSLDLAEEALRRNEARFRLLIESSPIPIMLAHQGKILYTNRAFTDLAKIDPPEPPVGASLVEFFAPEERERVTGFIKNRSEGGQAPLTFESIGLKRDGTKFPYEISIAVVELADGPATLAFIQDITGRKKAEAALRESEEKYRTLVENISEIVYTADEEGKFTYVSPAIERVSDYRAADLIGADTFSLIHPDDLAGVMDDSRALREGVIKPTEYRVRQKNGEYRWIMSTSRPNMKAGRFTGSNGVLTDIHERRLAEETLRDTVDTLHRSQQIAHISNWRYDIAARLFITSGEGLQSWGFHNNPHPSIEEVSRRIHPEDRAMVSRAFERAVNEGIPYSLEFRIRAKNSRETRYILSLGEVHRDENGSPDYLFGINQDITVLKQAEIERERMQAQLLQAQKMEAVGTLAGGIAHDFNNMLGGIMGSLNLVEMLLEKDTPPRKETLLKYVETAMDSSRRAADMIKQLLTISRKSGMQTAPVDVNLSLKHVLKLCRNSFPKSVGLDFHIGDTPLRVQADPVQIEQVFLNLCVNASHAMTVMRPEGDRQGGYLSVDIGEVMCDSRLDTKHPDARAGETYVRVRVSDTGVGINEETRRHIFDPFYTTKKREDGTGLGLAMAYSIVKQHGGFIDVYSEPGKGSTFTVYLPALNDTSPADAPKKARSPIVPGTGTVLVIDDEKAILRIAKGMLEQCGYRVLTAESGEEGLRLFREDPKKVNGVLLDLSMPEMSGMEVFISMKETDPDVKVLLASGLMEDDEVKKALALGVKGFLQKPYSAEELSVKMKEVIS